MAIDHPHLSGLEVAFRNIALIDAQRIDPEDQVILASFGTELLQSIPQVWCNGSWAPIHFNGLRLGSSTPRIGEAIVWRCSYKTRVEELALDNVGGIGGRLETEKPDLVLVRVQWLVLRPLGASLYVEGGVLVRVFNRLEPLSGTGGRGRPLPGRTPHRS